MVGLEHGRQPQVITPTLHLEDYHIIVTNVGPFDSQAGELQSWRHTHWDNGFLHVWDQAYRRAVEGRHLQYLCLPRPRQYYLHELLGHLREVRWHPRWHLILGTAEERSSYTRSMLVQDAIRQIEVELAPNVLVQDWCRWCGQPTSRVCDGFATATYMHPYQITQPAYYHACGAPLCAACDDIFEARYICSFWTGLPLPSEREPLDGTEPITMEVESQGSAQDSADEETTRPII